MRRAVKTSMKVCALAVFAIGCTEDSSPSDTVAEPPFTVDPETETLPQAELPVSRAPNEATRMKLDVLAASMSRVAGEDVNGKPIEWIVNGKNGFSDEVFGKALGRPDFQSTTEEQTVSSALYLKFVGDAARAMCTTMAKTDLARMDAEARVLFPRAPATGTLTDAQITENLQYLALRFLGLQLGADAKLIGGLRSVFDAGAALDMPEGAELDNRAEAWRGVCVALFEHPLFHNN